MTTDKDALVLPEREKPITPAELVWTPGHTTYSRSVPDRHDASEDAAMVGEYR